MPPARSRQATHLDRPAADLVQPVGGRLDEAAPVQLAELLCVPSAELEEVARDVGEDDLSGTPLECTERDEPVAAADVEQRLALGDLDAVEDAVSRAAQLLQQLLGDRAVSAEATLEQPLAPAVARRGHAASAARISSCSGKRPSRCFEKISSPSRTTSNWLFSPGIALAPIPLPSISAARLAARRS